MQVDGVGEIQLYDHEGFPVVWVDGVGPEQDPNLGGTNVYGPGDVFWDQPTASGNMYQVGTDFHIRPFGTPAPRGGQAASPVGAAAPAAAPQTTNLGDLTALVTAAIKAAGGSTPPAHAPTPPNTPKKTGTDPGTGAIGVQGDPKKFSHEVADWLNRSDFIQGVPNGFIAAGGVGVLLLMKGRKRR